MTILRALIDARGEVAPEAAAKARVIIAETEGLADIPANYRRCDEGVDEVIAARRRLQDAIVELQKIE